jgi:biopolymer transport protein ExbD
MEPIKAADVKAEINVTPLVDVVLVLLIIFMVVTPMLQKGQAVRLPQTDNPEKKAEEKSQIMVAVSEKKDYWVDKVKCTEAQFPQTIKEAFERNLNASVLLKADAHLTYGDVKKTMMKIRDAGFNNVGLVTEKRQKAS